jgi:hypothetical protein
MVFKYQIPNSLLNCLSFRNFGVWLMYTWFAITKCPATKYHWYQKRALPVALRGASMVAAHISMQMTGASWNAPCLASLLALKSKVAFIWGERDPIMPFHQFKAMIPILNPDVKCFVVKGAAHNPVKVERGEKLAAAITMALATASSISTTPALANAIRADNAVLKRYTSFFNTKQTDRQIKALYSWVKDFQPATPASELAAVVSI